MSGFLPQLLNGLSHATTLFLMAAGLTLIFGVTRIVNFAHGSFYMLGALFTAHWVTVWFPVWGSSAGLYLLAMLMGAAVAGGVGAVVDTLLLRRMARAPELYQLVATFGLTLLMSDAMRWAFGPGEVFAPRFPGLKGSLEFAGEFFPVYQLVLILLGPLVWWGLLFFLKHSAQGRRVRAATQDRDMLDVLGVNPRPLMMGVVVLGCALAGLGGALQLPREPATLQMDVNVVVETFVVVVMGGLGSITGAFLAAVLIGVVHSFGTEFFPQLSLVLVFLTMGAVLALRPAGLMGEVAQAQPREPAQRFERGPQSAAALALILLATVLVFAAVSGASDYWRSIATDALILLVFGLSLQAMMALGGLVSFGHAAFFALGAYGAALAHLHGSAGVWPALAAGVGLAVAVAVVFGAAVVRSSGVYLAMLSLAQAQVVWALASQWVGVTGGDNGLIGLNLVPPEGRAVFEGALLALALVALLALRRLAGSPFGMALQAVRDAPERAAASGLAVHRLKYQVFVGSAAWAGLAGGLFAAHKGAVFPSAASVAMSVDALLVVLLGGVHQLWGALAGSVMLTLASAELGRHFDYWRGLLGVLIMGIMVWSPTGLLGLRGLQGRLIGRRRA